MAEEIHEMETQLSKDELVELNIKSFEDSVLIVGGKLKSREVETDEKLAKGKLKTQDKKRLRKELKNEQEKVLDSLYLSYPSSKLCKADFFKLLKSDQDKVVLEGLRCLFWLLSTDKVEPGDDVILNCLFVADKTSDFATLLHVFKVLKQLPESSQPIRNTFFAKDQYTGLGNILAKNNGPARLSKALKQVAPSMKDDEKDRVNSIISNLDDWFISTQGKPIPKKDVSELVEYFTSMLMTGNHSQSTEGQVRNILVNLLNHESKTEQKQYVIMMVDNLREPCEDRNKVIKASLTMLVKLAGRGRSGVIRRVESIAVIDCLTSIIVSFVTDENDIIKLSLKLIIKLYEAPRYMNEHKKLKTDEFVRFLTSSIGKFDDCVQILRFLTFNDPHNATLKKHIEAAAKEIPDVKNAAGFTELLEVTKKKNYKHTCRKIGTMTYLATIWFMISYCKDSVLDLYISTKGILSGELVELSWLLLGFAILPLLVCNIVTLKSFYSSTPLSIYVSLEGHVPRFWFLKYIAPWRFDSGKHAFFNLFTFCQLHPVITAIDFIAHGPQPIKNILMSEYNLYKLGWIETMLENIPCLAIKVIQVAARIKMGGFTWNRSNVATVVTIVNSVLSQSKSILDVEYTSRFVDLGHWQIRLISQKATLFLSYLTMISSRILLIIILTRFEKWLWITALVFHVLVTFFIQLFSYHIKARKDDEEDEHYVFLRDFDIGLIPFALSEVFLILLRSPLEYLGAYSKYQYVRNSRLFFGIYFFHLTEVIAVNHCFMFFILQLHLSLSKEHQPMLIVSCVSIGLHIISGLLLGLYTFIFNPKIKKSFKLIPTDADKRRVLYNDEPEHDFHWGKNSCLKREENFTIGGFKMAKLACEFKPSTSTSTENEDQERHNVGPTDAFVKDYATKLNEEKTLFFSDGVNEERQSVTKKAKFFIHGVTT